MHDELTYFKALFSCWKELALKTNVKRSDIKDEEEHFNIYYDSFENKLKILELLASTLNVDKLDFFYYKELDKYYFYGDEVSKEEFDLLRDYFKIKKIKRRSK